MGPREVQPRSAPASYFTGAKLWVKPAITRPLSAPPLGHDGGSEDSRSLHLTEASILKGRHARHRTEHDIFECDKVSFGAYLRSSNSLLKFYIQSVLDSLSKYHIDPDRIQFDGQTPQIRGGNGDVRRALLSPPVQEGSSVAPFVKVVAVKELRFTAKNQLIVARRVSPSGPQSRVPMLICF